MQIFPENVTLNEIHTKQGLRVLLLYLTLLIKVLGPIDVLEELII